MTMPPVPAALPAGAGLPETEVAAWAAAAPGRHEALRAAAAAVSLFLVSGENLLARLPPRAAASPAEQAARDAIGAALTSAREDFLRDHAAALYAHLTGRCQRWLRLADLMDAAAAFVPGLVPSPAQLAAERARALPGKEGLELAQGLLAAHVLADPRAGRHLCEAMLRPLPAAREQLARLRATGTADLGPARVTRDGRTGYLELRNPRHLNAEDDTTLAATECAVDLVLLDPAIEVGVFRGGVVSHPRYRGQRVFGSGINLTHLYQGRIGYLFYLVRDLGYVSKIYRGLLPDGAGTGPRSEGGTEKLWIAAVEQFAIGGACQLLHVVDHVLAARGSRLFLPARKEGIIPGASNLRLPRFVGDRAARQAILSGREWTAGEPDAALLCDEVVAPGDMDRAIAARAAALADSGLVNAAANRRTIRAGQEPLDLFREYMAVYAREQARCHLSPALVRNLETHWRAHERTG